LAKYVVAVTGASGAAYGLGLIGELLKRGDDVELIISPSGFLLLKEEAGLELDPGNAAPGVLAYIEAHGVGCAGRLNYNRSDNLTASFASGSALVRSMVVCPCSMGTLARVASGASSNLIERAADCVLKERGRLVVVPRETPLSTIHIENMLRLARAGAVILPAMPGLYTHPESVDDIIAFVVGKVLDALGVENDLYRRWRDGRGDTRHA